MAILWRMGVAPVIRQLERGRLRDEIYFSCSLLFSPQAKGRKISRPPLGFRVARRRLLDLGLDWKLWNGWILVNPYNYAKDVCIYYWKSNSVRVQLYLIGRDATAAARWVSHIGTAVSKHRFTYAEPKIQTSSRHIQPRLRPPIQFLYTTIRTYNCDCRGNRSRFIHCTINININL